MSISSASTTISAGSSHAHRPLLDTSRLLAHAANAEAVFKATYLSNDDTTDTQDDDRFGHPDPPKWFLLALPKRSSSLNSRRSNTYANYDTSDDDNRVILTIAYTQHCIAAQSLSSQNTTKTDPVHLASLPLNRHTENSDSNSKHSHTALAVEEEKITCLVAFSLENTNLLNRGYVSSIARGSSTSVLYNYQQQQLQFDMRADDLRLVVVVGTNYSRILTLELQVDLEHYMLQKVAGSILCEVLPSDDAETAAIVNNFHKSKEDVEQKQLLSFGPKHGVVHLSVRTAQPNHTATSPIDATTQVWIAYGDGTLLRVHHAAFFPSLWQRGSEEGLSLDEMLGVNAVKRCRVQLPPPENEYDNTEWQITPLWNYHPSPLAPLPAWKARDDIETSRFSVPTSVEDDLDDDNMLSDVVESLVYCKGQASSQFPTLCFYTSENHFVGRIKGDNDLEDLYPPENPLIGAVLGSTKAIMGGVAGVFRWGLRGGAHSDADGSHAKDVPSPDDIADELPPSPFPSLWNSPLELYAGYDFHDSPRQIEECTIDPTGELVATSDTLGRILLFDLETKQLIRMWKGFRDASCYWLQEDTDSQHELSEPFASMNAKPGLYIAIHSRQRRVVEVWKVRHGAKVCTLSVGKDAEVLPCSSTFSLAGSLAQCFLLHSNAVGASTNHLERIIANNVSSNEVRPEYGGSKSRNKIPSTPQSREDALRLQHLQQMLSATSVAFTRDDVADALQQITSLVDLCTALDLLSTAPTLEQRLGEECTQFFKSALEFCGERLDESVRLAADDVQVSPVITYMSNKIRYHSQILDAFEILHNFECSLHDTTSSSQSTSPMSTWALEAMGWAHTCKEVLGPMFQDAGYNHADAKIKYTTFASSLVYPTKIKARSDRLKIHFSDSSRTRRDVLVHLFKPLLADNFSYGVVNSMIEALGFRKNVDYILQCFADWFMTLSIETICVKGINAGRCPMTRFLQDLVNRQIDKRAPECTDPLMSVIYKFCEASDDLTRAFMLCVLCRNAIEKVATKKEKTTYGSVSASKFVDEWERLIRKLRVCLLVSLRLKGQIVGAFPLTVYNIDHEDVFSVHEWVARDELYVSHKHDEIVSLEKACAISSHVFDPSTPQGDDPVRLKALQHACLTATYSADERSEYLVDRDDDNGALLLYLYRFNDSSILVAHRAMLLAGMWSKDPGNLELLQNCLTGLRSLSLNDGLASVAYAIKVDIWQSRLSPIYRARLFGFDDVQEISEETVDPLLQDKDWFAAFSRISLSIIDLIMNQRWEDGESMTTYELLIQEFPTDSWPPMKRDPIFSRLVAKSRQAVTESLRTHRSIICAQLISTDVELLVKCAPSIYECFMPLSLFNVAYDSDGDPVLRFQFLSDATLSLAQRSDDDSYDSFVNFDEIQVLCDFWNIDAKLLKAIYVLAMYELGKDAAIEEVLVNKYGQVDVQHFVEGGIGIICRRLHQYLNSKKMRSKDMREVVALLDADLCEWVHKKARDTKPLLPAGSTTGDAMTTSTIDSIHSFALRLLSLSASANVESTIRVKIHSLVVLSGTLVQATAADKTTN